MCFICFLAILGTNSADVLLSSKQTNLGESCVWLEHCCSTMPIIWNHYLKPMEPAQSYLPQHYAVVSTESCRWNDVACRCDRYTICTYITPSVTDFMHHSTLVPSVAYNNRTVIALYYVGHPKSREWVDARHKMTNFSLFYLLKLNKSHDSNERTNWSLVFCVKLFPVISLLFLNRGIIISLNQFYHYFKGKI